MLLKGALHVHTTCSDGELSIKEVVAAHEAQLFDFVALTDHDFLVRPNCYRSVNRIRTNLIIFKGMELTIFEKGYIHVNRIRGDKETLHIFNHPSELDLPLPKVKERIFGIAAQLPIDAIEITSKGFRTPEYDIDEIPYQKVATDDSHNRQMIGRAWIEMDCRRNNDSILQAIKAGDFWCCYAVGGVK